MIAEIYRKLAADESYRPELRAAFRQMALDEEDHADQIGFAMALPEESLAPTRIGVDDFLEKVQARFELVRTRSIPEDEVVLLALDLEEEFNRVHLGAMALFRDSRLRALFKGLARSEEEHLATLKPFLAG